MHMPTVFDHTIVPARDKEQSAKFYETILGFKDFGEQEDEGLRKIGINATTVLFFEKSNDSDSSPWSWSQGSHHYAFAMDKRQFNRAFSKSSGTPYGDSWEKPNNMKGPGRAPGAKGNKGRTIYFRDPSDNLVQILTY